MGDDFYRGVAAALTVVAHADEESLFREIVGACGSDDIIRVARRDGLMRLTGLVRYGYHRRQAGHPWGANLDDDMASDFRDRAARARRGVSCVRRRSV
jgi:hypothetical protein